MSQLFPLGLVVNTMHEVKPSDLWSTESLIGGESGKKSHDSSISSSGDGMNKKAYDPSRVRKDDNIYAIPAKKVIENTMEDAKVQLKQGLRVAIPDAFKHDQSYEQFSSEIEQEEHGVEQAGSMTTLNHLTQLPLLSQGRQPKAHCHSACCWIESSAWQIEKFQKPYL